MAESTRFLRKSSGFERELAKLGGITAEEQQVAE